VTLWQRPLSRRFENPTLLVQIRYALFQFFCAQICRVVWIVGLRNERANVAPLRRFTGFEVLEAHLDSESRSRHHVRISDPLLFSVLNDGFKIVLHVIGDLDDLFLEHKQPVLNGVVFDPNPKYVAQDRVYNLFDGYKTKAVQGDLAPFHDLMKAAICSGHEKNFIYLDALISQMYQEPHLKPGVAVVIRGDEGVGKSFFIEKIRYLMRPYYFKTSNPAFIFGDHNGALINKMLLHLEEAMWAGSKKDESKFKDTITGPILEINEKFQPLIVVDNHLHLFLTGNPDWLVKVGFNSRRIFALHASDIYRNDIPYFAKLDDWFFNGGAEALMHHWMTNDWRVSLARIGVKDLRLVPITEELIKQRKRSQSGLEKWAINCNEEGHYPYGDVKDGKLHVIKRLMVHAYNNSPEGKRDQLSDNEFGNRFCALFPKVIKGEVQKHDNGKTVSIIETGENTKITDCNGRRQYAYIIPLLTESRSALDFTLSLVTRM
jgi:hypothetical protein